MYGARLKNPLSVPTSGQYGIFVTTSYFHEQVYKEVRTDQHPVVLVCGRDIVETLRAKGVSDEHRLRSWLEGRYWPQESMAPTAGPSDASQSLKTRNGNSSAAGH